MHFYESAIVTSKDGLHFQVYGNEHPLNAILVKPKYIPTEKISSSILQSRFIAGRKMNRLNLWSDKEELKRYLEEFKKNYPHYILRSDIHQGNRLFFGLPIDQIERIYSPKRGISELMSISRESLDPHLKLVHDFTNLILQSGLRLEDLGITYSSLVGHYSSKISDINIVIHGKTKYWKLMEFLESVNHPLLKWKTEDQWIDFFNRRNRSKFFSKEEFLHSMSRKKSEGYFGDSLFVIFCVENEDERWFKWGEEKYEELGTIKIQGKIKDHYNSIVRPGFYKIENSKILEGYSEVPIKRIVFYSRDYAHLGYSGETLEAQGILERVNNKNGEEYYRVVVGYFDSYLNERREKEYLKIILPEKNKFEGDECQFCKESQSENNSNEYGSQIICRVGDGENGWFATLSPRTGGDINEDFSIQIIPTSHLRYFSEINKNQELAKNYGIIFAKISYAIGKIIEQESGSSERIPIATYGKCKHPDEHIHIKIFPYRNKIGQPFTTDSSYERKEIHQDENGKFVKMHPVKKESLRVERFNELLRKIKKHLETKIFSSDLNGTLVKQHTMSDMIRIYIGEKEYLEAKELFNKQTDGQASIEEAFNLAGRLTNGLTLRQAIEYTLKHMDYVTGFNEFTNYLSENNFPLVINSTGYSVTIYAIRERIGRDKIHGQIGNILEFQLNGIPLSEKELEDYVIDYFKGRNADPIYDQIKATGNIILGVESEESKSKKIIQYAKDNLNVADPQNIIHMGDTFGDSQGILQTSKNGGIGIAFNYNGALKSFLINNAKEEIESNKILLIDEKGGDSDLRNVIKFLNSLQQ